MLFRSLGTDLGPEVKDMPPYRAGICSCTAAPYRFVAVSYTHLMFFTSGGYHGGMPAFFVFAIIFTVLMLEKWRALIVSLLEIVLYLSLIHI